MGKRGHVSPVGVRDVLSVLREHRRPLSDELGLQGIVQGFLFDEDMKLKQFFEVENTITNYGDSFYAKRGGAISVNTVTGMALGTGGATAVLKVADTGTWIVTQVAGSRLAIDGGYPTATDKGSMNNQGWRITWQTTWAAGTATATGINEVTIVNTTPIGSTAETNSTATVSRATFTASAVNKGANDSLIIIWYHDFLGT